MPTLAQCYLCGAREIREIHGRCRDSETVKVLRCEPCGLVFLSDSGGISEDFYERSGMYEFAVPDRAALLAEESTDTARRISLLVPLVKGKRFLDFGCGAGAVALGLRERCSDTAVVELNQAHREALLATGGIRAGRALADLSGSFDVISLFHVLEHLKDPVSVLSELRERLAPGGQLIVEVPHALDALLSVYDLEAFKDFTYWTCHLFLFTEETLGAVLRKAGFAGAEVRFVQRYPLANHLYWIAKGKPGGHQLWKDVSSPGLDAAYAGRLAELKATDTLLAVASLA